MRLPASRRLRRHGEFARVKAGGSSQKGRFLVLNVLRSDDVSPWRCAFITTKKIGSAVERNRVRRRLREIVRAEGRRIAAGLWLVTIARWNAVQADFSELKLDWVRIAERAGIFQDKNS